jgi:CBS domain-containing protein
VDAEDSVERAVDLMAKEQVRRLPVENRGKVIGMISLGDIAKSQSCSDQTALALSDISQNVRIL